MSSEPGDYIGQGQEYLYTEQDSSVNLTYQAAGAVSASVVRGGVTEWWYIDLAAPHGEELAVGSYTGATRAVFREPGEPGLDVHGNGRGCNTLTGGFDVLTLERAPDGELLLLEAVFEQHCEGGGPALYGRLRIEVPPPPPDTTAPTIFGPESIRVEAADQTGADVHYGDHGVYASDDRDPAPSLTCTPASDTRFPLGSTTVSCTAQDASGNSATRTLIVEVLPRLQATSRLVQAGVSRSGAAVLSFEVTCTRTATVALYGSVEQAVTNRAFVVGSFATSVPCTSGARTTVNVTADRGTFGAGQATIRWSTDAFDDIAWYSAPAQTARVRLRSIR